MLDRLSFLTMVCFFLVGADGFAVADERPNVLFIAADDMNDWVSILGGYGGKVHAPNLEKLAARGTLFTNAHCASPVCCPSRNAIMSGMLPSSSGIYDNGQWWLPHNPKQVTMPIHFRRHGYTAIGSGKIFHHTAGSNPPSQWDAYHRLTFQNDPWFRGVKLNYPWSPTGPFPPEYPFNGVKGLGHENDWGSLSIPEKEYDDATTVSYAVEFLQQKRDKPFFLACGVFRPHLPWYAPRKYFDLYPVEDIQLPNVPQDDLDDIPAEGKELANARRSDRETIQQAEKWKHAIQAYLASISFADAQIGRLLDALDASGEAENTIIVFWSDHGWHLGEKLHWHKSTLWEEATRVPLIVVDPRISRPGQTCARAVSLIDVFPTLVELCGLPAIEVHDGASLLPQLRAPTSPRDRPAVIQYKRGQCAVRSDRYRYIRYSDGSEELYDHQSDPDEWHNLAGDRQYDSIKSELAQYATSDWAPRAPSKGAYEFDTKTYSWIRKQDGVVTRGL